MIIQIGGFPLLSTSCFDRICPPLRPLILYAAKFPSSVSPPSCLLVRSLLFLSPLSLLCLLCLCFCVSLSFWPPVPAKEALTVFTLIS